MKSQMKQLLLFDEEEIKIVFESVGKNDVGVFIQNPIFFPFLARSTE